jgi:hypothetical protein
MNHRKHLLGTAIVASLLCGGLAFAQGGATGTTSTTSGATATSPAATSPATTTTSPTTAPSPVTGVTAQSTHGSAVSGTARTAPTGSSAHGAAGSSVAHGVRDFKRLDADRNGTLSNSEVASLEGFVFTDVDTDANLSLSQAEFDAYLSSRAVVNTGDDSDSTMDDRD